jgi:hypothetical protein
MLDSQPSRGNCGTSVRQALTAGDDRDYILARDVIARWIDGSREVRVSS